MHIQIGCCGWPVGRSGYFQRFSTVEINSTFYNLPQLKTAVRWRQEAPAEFEFSVKAWQLITHPAASPTYRKLREKLSDRALSRCGNFRASPEVAAAWERTRAVASALAARFVLFQTPASFYPNANHLRDLYRFFKGVQRGGLALVWETRGEGWEDRMVHRVCGDLGLVRGVDPLSGAKPCGAVCYYRLHGRHERGRPVYGHDYTDEELREILIHSTGRPTYAYFNNVSMWRDACRFQSLVRSSSQDIAVPRRLRTLC